MVVILLSYFWWKIWWCSDPVQPLLISVPLCFSLNFCSFWETLALLPCTESKCQEFPASSKLFSKSRSNCPLSQTLSSGDWDAKHFQPIVQRSGISGMAPRYLLLGKKSSTWVHICSERANPAFCTSPKPAPNCEHLSGLLLWVVGLFWFFFP